MSENSRPVLTVELVESYIGKDVSEIAIIHFSHVPFNRRTKAVVRAIRDLGFSVSRDGIIYRGKAPKPAFENLLTVDGVPYGRLSGRIKKGSRMGLTAIFFPSKYKPEFSVMLRSWGKSGFSIPVRPEDIEVTPVGVRVKLGTLEIVPNRPYQSRFENWMKAVKLPFRGQKEVK